MKFKYIKADTIDGLNYQIEKHISENWKPKGKLKVIRKNKINLSGNDFYHDFIYIQKLVKK